MSQKSIQLYPEPKYNFWWYVAGVLLIPVFGIGIYILFKKKKEMGAIRYEITNQSITAIDSRYSETADLINIHSIDLSKRWIDEKFGIGTLLVRTESRTIKMIGMNNPEQLADTILQAAEAERIRQKKMTKKKAAPPESKPGTKTRMDYLTGLWQQGLISEEDFEKERKHFES
jgi:hypothetical protein